MPLPGWPSANEPNRGSSRFDDASRGPRLHKVLAEAGVGSRRACETLIEEGAVCVNGHEITKLPAWVDPAHDVITVNGQRIRAQIPHVYIMLFKPRGVICTNAEHQDRPRAIDLVQHKAAPRLYPVGRLDTESSGLLLLTNDGELANRITHPRYGVHKAYDVTVEGRLDENDVAKLERGVFLIGRRTDDRQRGRRPGRRTTESKLTLIRRERDRTRIRMELGEGRNRQIRKMMLYVGHKVRKLRRVELGPLKLTGLRPGQWRELTDGELTALKKAAYKSERKPKVKGKAKSKPKPQKQKRAPKG